MPAIRNRADKTRRLAASSGMALGAALALFGVGIDYIFANASPGLGLPQLAIVAAGLSLALGAFHLRKPSRRQLVTRRALAKALAIALLTLLALEVALTVAGLPTNHPAQADPVALQPAPWWQCDETGCRFEYEAARAACARGEISGRNCVVNRQGYSDSGDFALDGAPAERQRILVLGDSFTQGYTADIGHAFVEVMEAALPEAIIWNAAITGNGTQESLAAFKRLAPILQPQLTVLGFYMNDFLDNLLPVGGGWLMATTADGNLVARRYRAVDRWGNSFYHKYDAGMLLALSAGGRKPPPNDFEWTIGKTRLGSLALSALDRLAILTYASPHPRQVEATRRLLRQLRDAASDLGSRLLALVIPYPDDLKQPGDKALAAQRLLDELGIAYLPLHAAMSADMYHDPLVDPHWNNAGHAKVGALLTDCARAYFVSGSFVDCAHVVLP